MLHSCIPAFLLKQASGSKIADPCWRFFHDFCPPKRLPGFPPKQLFGNPPAAHGKDQNGHLQSKVAIMGIFGWELLYMNLLSNCKMTRKIPRKKINTLKHRVAPQVAISGASVFVVAPVPNAVRSPHFFFEAKSRRMTWWRDLWLGLNSVMRNKKVMKWKSV